MSNKSPIFPMPDPQHFSDYGFDHQIDYFQVLEEAMKHRRETERSIDSIRFKLQKPIAKDEHSHSHSHSNSNKAQNKKRWWKNLFKWKWTYRDHHHHEVVHQAFTGNSISGPVYLTESRSGSATPYRTTGRPSSGPLPGKLLAANRDQGLMDVPYLSLRGMNMEQQQQKQRMSTSALPVYLVT